MNKILKFFSIIYLSFITLYPFPVLSEEKIKIGLLVPLTGDNKDLGELIIKSTRMALNDINTDKIEIYPKDTGSDPDKTLRAANELRNKGINIVIGPIFHKNLSYLDEIKEIIFLSLTNKTIGIPDNVISSGVNATSQLNTIKKFILDNDIKKTIFLTPKLDYEEEIKKSIKQSKIKISKHYIYDTEPTKLTSQIEKITNYKVRKQNLIDEITRVENSDLVDKEKQLEKLKKKYTLGKVKFDSVIVSDFDESLKSVITSLLYSDVSPKKKYMIVFNQWFDESLLNDENIQPLYYPSINQKNLKKFQNKFKDQYNEIPNHLAFLSYDLVGLVYYLTLNSDLTEINKVFKKKKFFQR